jgi:hypothetical protein
MLLCVTDWDKHSERYYASGTGYNNNCQTQAQQLEMTLA